MFLKTHFALSRQWQEGLTKTLRVMKLTAIILLTAALHVSAKGFSQKVTLSERDAPMEKVFQEIRRQTGYNFLYNDAWLQQTNRVTIQVKKVSLAYALNICFKGQPFTYSIVEQTIVVKQQTIPALQEEITAPPVDISGKITDKDGNPLVGATVKVRGTGKATTTNNNGEFIILGVEENGVLEVSYVGYESTGTTFNTTSNKYISVTLALAENKLDEIQIVGYGTTTKRKGTGSVSKITAAEISRQPVSNPILALQGKAPGVYLTESSGISGSNFNIIIQGQNTISAGRLPLYIIDGVPFGGRPIETTTGSSTNAPPVVGGVGFSPLNTLSPNDIESIEILKDADATAIYGSRAANGVVVITTKKGKAGANKLDVNLYSGISSVTRTFSMLNAGQYLSIRNKAFANDNIIPTTANAADLTTFNTGGNTDFQKYLIGNNGHFTDATAAFSGGNQFTQFLISANYRKETPVFPSSFDFADKKAQVRFNVQHRTANNKFSINVSASYTKDNNNLAPFDLSRVYNLAPNLPLYKSNGSLAWFTGYVNPLSTLKSIYFLKTANLISNATINYNILPGLSFKTDFGYNKISVEGVNASTRASQDPSVASSASGTAIINNTNNELYLVEPQLNYSRRMGKGKLEALAGGTYQYSQYVQPLFALGAFTSDALYSDIASMTIFLKGSGFTETKYASAFGRLNYNWAGKYIINGSFRRDGSSRFSPNNRYGNFGSIGGAWVFSEEGAIKRGLSWLSFGKLRASYGSVGNDQIGDYGYVPFYSATQTPYAGVTGLYPVRLDNQSNYSWEVTKKFNVSIDIGLLTDRILFSATWYRNRTSNPLLNNLPIASQTGFVSFTGNLPDALVQNKGWELELSSDIIKKQHFKWNASINFTAPENKLISFPGLASTFFATGFPGQGFVVGQSLNLLAGYRYDGLKNGLPTAKDLNGNGTISTGLNANGRGDFDVLGTSDPKFYGGFNNSITYKAFQLDATLQFVKKMGYNIYNNIRLYPGANANFPADILKYGFTYSSLANAPSSQAFTNIFRFSDETVSDASFVRLKNVSLSYSLPSKFIKHLKIKNSSVYIRAQNLFTITKYKGLDPETLGTAIPPMKMILVGVQASF